MKRRIVNVADGVNDSDAATVGQISKITGMDSEKGNVVQYDGEDKHPSEMKYTASYEDGQDIFTCRFSYLEIDKEGNWLQREVNRTWEIVMYNHVDNTEETITQTDPPFIETRSITYY